MKPAAVMPESDALSWSGGYIGANVGYGWGHSGSSYDNQVGPFIGVNPDTDPAGVLGGVTLGANQEIGNNLVIGVEGDIDYANLTDTIDDQAALNGSRPGQTITATTDWTGTLRGRVGVAVDKILPYLTAGLAVAHSTVSATDGPLSASATLGGWTAGGGVEFAIDDHWSAKAEYLYTDLGSHTWFSSDIWASTSTSTSSTVRGGINDRF